MNLFIAKFPEIYKDLQITEINIATLVAEITAPPPPGYQMVRPLDTTAFRLCMSSLSNLRLQKFLGFFFFE